MPNYEDALAALKAICPDADRFATLSKLMLRACNRAVAWKNPDHYAIEREADRRSLASGLPSLKAAVGKVQDLAEKHKRGFDAVVWRAVKDTGITPDMMRALGYVSEAGGQGGRFMRALLTSLYDQLEAETSPDTRRAIKGKDTGGVHRYVHGPLRYPKVVDRARMPHAVITGLQFELVFYLRRHTHGQKGREIAIDDTLPANGQPHYDIIDQFTNAAINHYPSDGGEAFVKAIKSNTPRNGKPVRWWGWGAPEDYKATDDVIVFWDSAVGDESYSPPSTRRLTRKTS